MKRDHAVSAVTKVWFQSESLLHPEVEGYRCMGILDPKQIRVKYKQLTSVIVGI